MRIALDATYSIDPHPSGIAIYSRELLKGLSHQFPDDELIQSYRAKQFLRVQADPSRRVRRRLLLPPLPTFRAEIFHALNQRVDRRPAPGVVTTFHDLFVMTGEYSSAPFRARFAAQARRAVENSDLIIAVSEFTAKQVRDLLGVAPSRIRVVPHGVRMPVADTTINREKVILSVGALQKRKNIGRLVEAFAAMPLDWLLLLAGHPGGYQAAAVLESIEQSACRDRIRITGYLSQQELEKQYARASIFAFPSLDEGFGIPVLEAMAHGVPVITSDRSALREVAGDAAILVNPDNTDEIAAALRRLSYDGELREKLANHGRSRAKLYSWEQTVRSTHAVYEELART